MRESPNDRLEEILASLLDQPRPEREARLGDLCNGEPEIQARVCSLLRVHERLGGFLAEPPMMDAGNDDAASRIRGFTITRKIASGGMGTVYEAQQEHPRRTVALKLLREGAASSSAMKRFRNEAEILGRLQHPNIAQIHEAGTLDDGHGEQPFFAMEYIQGRPLLEHTAGAELGTHQRLALMVKICDAVQYAHLQGVIHRDLKPDNILVGDSGEPKILDFGIARATDADLRTTTMQTHVGQLIGTIPYMSPEQVSGDPQQVDTRSDVYSLGVVLYEVLCGELPYALADKSIPDAARIIRDEDPASLSSISRVFRGDLDTITAKALEKNKDRRYQTAGELAADLRHFLDDEPITARPASTLYQLGKFARRNKSLVAGVAAAFVFLVAGMTATTWQAVHARSEAARALVIKEFLEETLKGTDAAIANRKRTAEQVLDAAVEGIEEQLAGEPVIEAEVRHIIGLAYASMTAMDKGIEQLQRALDLRTEFLGPERDETLETAQSLAETLHEQGLWIESARLLRGVVEVRTRRLPADHPDTLWAMTWLARSLKVQDQTHEAVLMARRALAGLQQKLGAGDPWTIRARYVYGSALVDTGKRVEAGIERRRSFTDAMEFLGPQDKMTLEMKFELGGFLWQYRSDRDGGEPLMQEAIRTNRELFGPDDLHTCHWTLIYGALLAEAGNIEAAEPHLHEGLAGLRRTLGDHNVRTAFAMAVVAEFKDLLGDLNEAERLLINCVQIRRELLTERHRDTPAAMSYLGWVQHRLGNYQDAQVRLREALDLQNELHGPLHANTLGTGLHLGQCLRDTGQLLEAEQHLLTALDGYRVLAGEGGEDLAGHPSASGNERPTRLQSGTDEISTIENLILLYEAWGEPLKEAEYRDLLHEARKAD